MTTTIPPTTEVSVEVRAFGVDIDTRTAIAAPPAAVWAALTDTASYEDWNPFMQSLDGDVTDVGSRLSVTLSPPGRSPMRIRPRVVEHVEGRRFAWLGRLGVPGLLDGRHEFQVDAHGAGSVVHQREHFTGLLVPVLRRLLTDDTPPGFAAMNEALRDQVERG